MDDNEKFDEMVKHMTEPVKYAGIDAFFGALTFLVVTTLVPLTVIAWRWAF